MEKLEMRFGAGMILAVNCMLRIVAGTFFFKPEPGTARLEEPDLDGLKKAEVPVWCNFAFSFFSKIKATSIKLKNPEGDGSGWEVERNVLFFYRDAIVAVVTLVGRRYVRGYDEGAMWGVSKVRYARYAIVAVSKEYPDAEQWVELELIYPAFVENV